MCVFVCVDLFHVAQDKKNHAMELFKTKFLGNQRNYQLLRKDAVLQLKSLRRTQFEILAVSLVSRNAPLSRVPRLTSLEVSNPTPT